MLYHGPAGRTRVPNRSVTVMEPTVTISLELDTVKQADSANGRSVSQLCIGRHIAAEDLQGVVQTVRMPHISVPNLT